MADPTISVAVVNSGNGSTNQPTGQPVPLRAGGQGELIVQQVHGKLFENAVRGKLFYGSNGATPSVTTVALATTYTGLCLYNPAASGKNVIVERVGYSFLVAFPAASTIGLLAGYSAAGVVTASAAASPGAPCLIGSSYSPVGRCALSATLVGTPFLHTVLGAGLTGAITTVPQNLTWADLDGSLVLPPGAYTAIYTSTVSGAASLAASFIWAEEPI